MFHQMDSDDAMLFEQTRMIYILPEDFTYNPKRKLCARPVDV